MESSADICEGMPGVPFVAILDSGNSAHGRCSGERRKALQNNTCVQHPDPLLIGTDALGWALENVRTDVARL